MSSAKLEALKDELIQAQRVITPQIEGLHDFARLNLLQPTSDIVQVAITDFERRLRLINEGLAALDNLQRDVYPNVDVRSVIETVYDDLSTNVSTIEAAFSKFAPIAEAAKATIISGNPEPKL